MEVLLSSLQGTVEVHILMVSFVMTEFEVTVGYLFSTDR